MQSAVQQERQLAGIHAKISRAAKHIIDFYNAKKIFLESSPFTFAHTEDVNTGRYHVVVADIKPVPLDLSLMIGDAIHNLRSALDLLACQLIMHNVNAHDCTDVYFPISDNSEKFMKILTRDKIQLMGKPAIHLLEQLQPYQGGIKHELWILHRLNIQDKHRLLIVAPTAINSWQGETIFVPQSPNTEINNSFEAKADVPINDLFIPKIGDSIVGIDPSYFSNGRDGEIHVHFRFEGDIAFNEPGIIKSKSAFNVLRSFIVSVEDTINRFESLFH